MFIAARRIQSHWRGHRVRKLLHQRWQAAVAIQRWWRGFRLRRTLWEQLERRLQDTILEHFHLAATRIQALFRGWRDRRTIHDVRNLRRMQTSAAEDLINCVILQLHQIRQAESLPGLLSLRNCVCLSRVEKLMTTMLFRFHNGRVVSMVANRMSQKDDQRKDFETARFHTQFPYDGPNFNELCHVRDEDQVDVKDLTTDLRFCAIVAEYQESQRDEYLRETHRRFDSRKRQEQMEHIKAGEIKSKRKFCADVVERMRKWNIWNGSKMDIKKNMFQSPENVQLFFKRVKHLMSDYSDITAEDLRDMGSFEE
ncbi:hypothetical protein KR084_002674 [Drosophila pseudotakahashii]|nr:hypothetical protein KR084_002674 [Drosophila pseudotakahashii]